MCTFGKCCEFLHNPNKRNTNSQKEDNSKENNMVLDESINVMDNLEDNKLSETSSNMTNDKIIEEIVKSVEDSKVEDLFAYSCDKCDYKTTTKSNLKQHIKSIYDKVMFSCEQCDYKTANKNSLNQHLKSIHEKVDIQNEEQQKHDNLNKVRTNKRKNETDIFSNKKKSK